MINRKSIIGAIVGLLLLTGIIGANLVLASNQPGRAVKQQHAITTGSSSEGRENTADDKNEGPENTADDKNEKAEGPENTADDKGENEANDQNEANDPNDGDEKNG
jgi:hypothetical protein